MSKIDDLVARFCPDGVEYRALGEMGTIVAGLSGKTKSDFNPDANARFVSYKNVFANPVVDLSNLEFVRIEENERQNRLHLGDIIFTGSSESAEEAGMTSVLTVEPPFPLYLNSFCFAFRLSSDDVLLPGFSKHLFRSNEIRRHIVRTASGVTRYNVSKQRLLRIRIPVPSMEVQEEIARVLDTLTELEAELQAELEARRKQYAYYRDKLLDFGDGGGRLG